MVVPDVFVLIRSLAVRLAPAQITLDSHSQMPDAGAMSVATKMRPFHPPSLPRVGSNDVVLLVA